VDPVFRPKTQPNKDLERFRDSVKFGNACLIKKVSIGVSLRTPAGLGQARLAKWDWIIIAPAEKVIAMTDMDQTRQQLSNVRQLFRARTN